MTTKKPANENRSWASGIEKAAQKTMQGLHPSFYNEEEKVLTPPDTTTKISQRKKLRITDNVESYAEKLKRIEDNSVVYCSRDFSDKFDTAVLVFISDWHLGARHFTMESAINVIEYVLNTPNALLFALGDNLNTAILNAVSNMYEDLLYPQEQWDLVLDLLTQVAKQGKLVVYHDGNHERRIYKQTGLSVGKQTAAAMGSEETYAPHFGVSNVVLKNKDSKDGTFTFNLTSHHGDGVNFVKMQNLNPSANLNVVGHWHRFELEESTRTIFDEKTGKQYYETVMNIKLPNAGKTPFEYSHLEKEVASYFAVEISSAKNPLYNPNLATRVQYKEFIPTMRSIPIYSIANTKVKDEIIANCKKKIDTRKQEYIREFAVKIYDALSVLEKAGVEMSKEIKPLLKTLYKSKEDKKGSSQKEKPQNENGIEKQ